MNIRPLESLTKEELIELVKHEREHIADTRKMVSDGWKLVPVERIQIALESIQDAMSDAYNNGYQECCGRGQVECCGNPDVSWSVEDQRIMDALSPAQRELSALLAAPTIKQSLTAQPTDSEMLDWVVDNWQTVEYTEDKGIFEVWTATCRHEGKTARDAISKAMRGEE